MAELYMARSKFSFVEACKREMIPRWQNPNSDYACSLQGIFFFFLSFAILFRNNVMSDNFYQEIDIV